MKMSDADVIHLIRLTLREWADERQVDDPPALTAAAPLTSARRMTPWLIAAAATLALVVAGAVVWSRRSETDPLVQLGPRPSATVEIRVGARWGVRGIAITDDAVWVASQADESLFRIDPTTDRVVETFPLPDHVEGVVAAGGWLWSSRYEPNEILRVDPASGAVSGRLAFATQPALVTDGDQLWVIAGVDDDGAAFRIDPTSMSIVEEVPLEAPGGFGAIGAGSLWVANFGRTTVTRIDLADRRVRAVIDVGAEPRDVVVAGASAWVATNGAEPERAGKVVRIDNERDEVIATIPTGRDIGALAATDHAVWTANRRDGTVSVIDVRTAELVATTPIADTPGSIAAGVGSVWIAPFRDSVVVRLDPTAPLEAAARADLERAVRTEQGTLFVRCSGAGSPTVVLEANTGTGAGSLSLVEARLARRTRVCSYDRVGIADPDESGSAGRASVVAADLRAALDDIGEHGPFVAVGLGSGALYTEMFAAANPQLIDGVVVVNGIDEAYLADTRRALPPAAREKWDQDLRIVPELRFLEQSAAEVAASEDPVDVPTIVLADGPVDAAAAAAESEPPLTPEEVEALDRIRQDTARRLADRTSDRRLIVVDGAVTADDIVDAIASLLE